MRKAEPPVSRWRDKAGEPKAGQVLRAIMAEPGEWFEITDDFSTPGNARMTVSSYVGNHYTPLEFTARKDRIFVRWNEGE